MLQLDARSRALRCEADFDLGPEAFGIHLPGDDEAMGRLPAQDGRPARALAARGDLVDRTALGFLPHDLLDLAGMEAVVLRRPPGSDLAGEHRERPLQWASHE